MDINKIPMVRVTWMDALDGETGWQDLETMLKGELATCMDVGWMIKNNDKCVVIMGSWCTDPDDKNGGRYITVPKSGYYHILRINLNNADI